MKSSTYERSVLLAAVAMTMGTLAVASLVDARVLRGRTAAVTSTATATAIPTAIPTSTLDSIPNPDPTATSISADGTEDQPPPVVRRAPRERIQVPRTVSAWGT